MDNIIACTIMEVSLGMFLFSILKKNSRFTEDILKKKPNYCVKVLYNTRLDFEVIRIRIYIYIYIYADS